MKTSKLTKAAKEERATKSANVLKQHLSTGDRVWCNITKTAASGMSRRIRCYIPLNDDGTSDHKPTIYDITWHVANVLDWPLNDDGIRVDGCGMDMGFHLVSTMARSLFGDYKTLDRVWM